jgi:hypothetical protein
MRQTSLYKSSRITLLSYLISQLEYSLLNPCFSTDKFSWVLNMDLMLKSWRREDRLPDTSPRLNSRFIQINEMAAESVRGS